ncbi:MAG: carbon-monoxide dehydrogenase large subunit [Acidimicrobiia bacterium]|nr:MAG: carbon-monoxide dehydrogenase large subunit [Acidimicrobiia bacterium]
MNQRILGRSVVRKEDERLVTGRGRYVGDIHPEGLLHARFVRSDVAHGSVTSVDVDAAREAPGVVAVLTAEDVPLVPLPVDGTDLPPVPRPLLAGDRVRHVGEPVAVVIGETEQAAFDAAELVWPDIDPLPPLVEPDQAASGEPIHTEFGSNVVERSSVGNFDPDQPWEFEVDVTLTVRNQRLAPVPIEPLAALGVPEGEGVTLYVTHQAAHRLRDALSRILPFPVEVVVPDVGGGFGMKGRFFPEYAVVALAAHRLGRPVRWLQTRRESMVCGTHGRDMVHTVRIAGDRDGRIRRVWISILASTGAYPHTGAQVPRYTRLVSQEMYDVPELRVDIQTVLTNTAPTAPYRGAGRPEAAYAMERAVDRFARACGLDPIDVRRKNLIDTHRLPLTTIVGARYDSGDYRKAVDAAVRLIDLDRWRSEQRRRREEGGNPIGIGLGAFVERAGGPPESGEYARVQIDEDGTVRVFSGAVSNGQGHETAFAQVAAEVFSVPIDRVEVIEGDTRVVPRGWGSMASRSAQIGGSAILRVSTRLRDRLREVAAAMLEASPSDLELSDGRFVVAGVPSAGVDLEEVIVRAKAEGLETWEEEFYSPGAQTFPYGVHAAVVEVELDTGEVRLLDMVAVDDCGTVINPMIVEGQTHGSLAQGIGQALFEQVQYDDQGQLRTATLMDYALPHSTDLPFFRTARLETPAPSNPLGAKGAGEGGCIGAPPAVVNAVLDALWPYGVEHLDMPLRPAVVWEALQRASGGQEA